MVQWLRLALSKRPNKEGVFPFLHLRTETYPVSETVYFLVPRWTKPKNPVILSIIHHRQNPLESTRRDNWHSCTLHPLYTWRRTTDIVSQWRLIYPRIGHDDVEKSLPSVTNGTLVVHPDTEPKSHQVSRERIIHVRYSWGDEVRSASQEIHRP
jgi:hypothetical protein